MSFVQINFIAMLHGTEHHWPAAVRAVKAVIANKVAIKGHIIWQPAQQINIKQLIRINCAMYPICASCMSLLHPAATCAGGC